MADDSSPLAKILSGSPAPKWDPMRSAQSRPCGDGESAAAPSPEFLLALSAYRDQSAGREPSVQLNTLPIADVVAAAMAHAKEDPGLRRLSRTVRNDTGESFGGLVGIARSWGAEIGGEA